MINIQQKHGDKSVTNDDIDRYIRALPLHKAGGHDSLANKHLRHGSSALVKPLTHLLNLMLYHVYVSSLKW